MSHTGFVLFIDFIFYQLCFNPVLLPVISQGFKAKEEVRTGVNRMPEGCWSLAPLQTAKCLMGAGRLMVDLRERTFTQAVCHTGCLPGRAKESLQKVSQPGNRLGLAEMWTRLCL